MNNPISEMRKQSHREVKQLACRWSAAKRQSQDSEAGTHALDFVRNARHCCPTQETLKDNFGCHALGGKSP